MDKHRQCIADGECAPRHRARRAKNNRWCGGHTGLLHVWVWRLRDERYRGWATKPGYIAYHRECIQCGKHKWDIRYYCRNCHLYLGPLDIIWYLFERVKPCPHCGENLLR